MLHASEDSAVLRATTTSGLAEFINDADRSTLYETAWLSPTQQLEEAWFLGLRRNAGVSLAALRAEFGVRAIEPSLQAARRLAEDGLLTIRAGKVALTARGRLISNDVFAEFVGISRESNLEDDHSHVEYAEVQTASVR
jgi:oxygen-independent coproporphyrinogen-3 oxidase